MRFIDYTKDFASVFSNKPRLHYLEEASLCSLLHFVGSGDCQGNVAQRFFFSGEQLNH